MTRNEITAWAAVALTATGLIVSWIVSYTATEKERAAYHERITILRQEVSEIKVYAANFEIRQASLEAQVRAVQEAVRFNTERANIIRNYMLNMEKKSQPPFPFGP